MFTLYTGGSKSFNWGSLYAHRPYLTDRSWQTIRNVTFLLVYPFIVYFVLILTNMLVQRSADSHMRNGVFSEKEFLTAFLSRFFGLFRFSQTRVFAWFSIHIFPFCQCCGSMTFWGGSGSGSADPCLWLLGPDSDPDPDPGSGSCYFRHWPSRCQQKTNFLTQFFLLITFWRYIYIIFLR